MPRVAGKEMVWTEDVIIQAIIRWVDAEGGIPPGVHDWGAHAERPDWAPHASTVMKRFGSWTAAIEAASAQDQAEGGQGFEPWHRG